MTTRATGCTVYVVTRQNTATGTQEFLGVVTTVERARARVDDAAHTDGGSVRLYDGRVCDGYLLSGWARTGRTEWFYAVMEAMVDEPVTARD